MFFSVPCINRLCPHIALKWHPDMLPWKHSLSCGFPVSCLVVRSIIFKKKITPAAKVHEEMTVHWVDIWFHLKLPKKKNTYVLFCFRRVGPPPELVRQRETKWINIILQWDSMLLKKTNKVCLSSDTNQTNSRCTHVMQSLRNGF